MHAARRLEGAVHEGDHRIAGPQQWAPGDLQAGCGIGAEPVHIDAVVDHMGFGLGPRRQQAVLEAGGEEPGLHLIEVGEQVCILHAGSCLLGPCLRCGVGVSNVVVSAGNPAEKLQIVELGNIWPNIAQKQYFSPPGWPSIRSGRQADPVTVA